MNYQPLHPKSFLSTLAIALAAFSIFSTGHHLNAQTTDAVTTQTDSTHLGLQVSELPKALLRHIHGLNNGVFVELVAEESTAEKMGMKPGDILCQINGVDVVRVRNFAQIQKLENVRLMRGGRYFMIVNQTLYADNPFTHPYAANPYARSPNTIPPAIRPKTRKSNGFGQPFGSQRTPNFTQQQRRALQASKHPLPSFNPSYPTGSASVAVSSSSSSIAGSNEAIAMSNTNGQWEIEMQIPGLPKKLHLSGTRDEVLAQVQSMAASQDVREAVRKRLIAAGL